MHALSLATWLIHITTVFEWIVAIILISRWRLSIKSTELTWLSVAMLPNLASAMAAVTWHIYDNAAALKGLVVLQAALTVIGNSCMALAAWHIVRSEVALKARL